MMRLDFRILILNKTKAKLKVELLILELIGQMAMEKILSQINKSGINKQRRN